MDMLGMDIFGDDQLMSFLFSLSLQISGTLDSSSE
jgi:hypothetical protein